MARRKWFFKLEIDFFVLLFILINMGDQNHKLKACDFFLLPGCRQLISLILPCADNVNFIMVAQLWRKGPKWRGVPD